MSLHVNPLFQDCFLFLFFFFSTLLCVSFLDLCFRNFLSTRFNTINDLNPRLTSSHIRRRQGLLLHLESSRVFERYFSKGGIKIRRKKRIDKGREGLRKRRGRRGICKRRKVIRHPSRTRIESRRESSTRMVTAVGSEVRDRHHHHHFLFVQWTFSKSTSR